jgi:serine/threonine protein kinase
MTNLTGQSLGRYHILEQLGEGGMATVYKALDTRLERYVAIKVIRTDMFGRTLLERMFKRFEREAKSLAKLSHPNIVKVLDYGEHEGAPFIAMEFIPGGTLKDKLKGIQLPWLPCIRLLLPVAQALAYAHEAGIIHRDVKPSNILVTKSGEPMLSDFGIAKILEDETSTELTATGAGIGTPEYMAPEQGLGQADGRADVYALGIVLYQMLTGHIPFRADTPMAVMLKKNTEPLPRPSQFVQNLPPAVENVLIKALARDRENRYPNMMAFVTALKALLNPKNVAAAVTEGTTTIPESVAAPRMAEKSPKGGWTPWIVGIVLLSACCVVAVVGALVWQRMLPGSDFATATPSIPIIVTETPPAIPTNTEILSTPNMVTETLPAVPSNTPILPSPVVVTATPIVINTPLQTEYDLTFASDRGRGVGELRTIVTHSDNFSDFQILENPNGYERVEWPTFCGQQVGVEAFDTGGSLPQWIYLLSEGASQKVARSQNADALGVPRCSPNGRYLAYSAQAGSYFDLMVLDLQSGQIVLQPRARTYGEIAGNASWTADSQSFIFEVFPDNIFVGVNGFPASPSNPFKLNVGQTGVHPAISPDGSKMAFACNKDHLCVTSLSGGQVQDIFATQSDLYLDWRERVTPVWSADGQWIYFASVDGGDWDIFRIRPDGSDAENLTSNWPSNEVMPSLRW